MLVITFAAIHWCPGHLPTLLEERLWHLIHCLPCHLRSLANPGGFNVHAGSPAAPWSLQLQWFTSILPEPLTPIATTSTTPSQGSSVESHPFVSDYICQPFNSFLLLLPGSLIFRLVETSSSLILFFPFPLALVFTSLPNQVDSTTLHFSSSIWYSSSLLLTFWTVLPVSDLLFKSILHTATRVVSLLNLIILPTCPKSSAVPHCHLSPISRGTMLPQHPCFCTC